MERLLWMMSHLNAVPSSSTGLQRRATTRALSVGSSMASRDSVTSKLVQKRYFK